MNPENAKQLVRQLQIAHRIAVAFYRRILPAFDHVGATFRCEFWHWETLETEKPPKAGTRPSSKWAWNFVPLLASSHAYVRTGDTGTSESDLAVTLCLYIDGNIDKDELKKQGIKGQPDPLTLPDGKATVEIHVFRPSQASRRSFKDLYESSKWPVAGKGWQSVGDGMQGCCVEVGLEDVLANASILVDMARPMVDAPIPFVS